LSFGRRAKNSSCHETNKKYLLSTPLIVTLLGIEVVGRFWPKQKSFDKMAPEQLKSLKVARKIIAKEYNLSMRK